VQLDELKTRAAQKALALPEAGADEADRLRADLSGFFGRIPEPPVYRRREDPSRAQALTLLAEGEELLARVQKADDVLASWKAALEAHLEAQCRVADGQVDAAEEAWRRALVLEQQAANERRVWARSDEGVPRVYSRESGESRFDPRPEPSVQVKLICPSCRAVHDYALSPRHATHRFNCSTCREPFHAYIGELRQLEIERKDPHQRRYMFRIDELQGATTRIHFDDASEGELSAARRDLMAFLYAPPNHLRGVLNLTSSRVLWITTKGPCFVATVAFGEGAPELDAFRGFRDRVLMPHAPWVVRAYYAKGPAWAQWLSKRPLAKRLVRTGLRAFHKVIS
jgi:hypothetical protein